MDRSEINSGTQPDRMLRDVDWHGHARKCRGQCAARGAEIGVPVFQAYRGFRAHAPIHAQASSPAVQGVAVAVGRRRRRSAQEVKLTRRPACCRIIQRRFATELTGQADLGANRSLPVARGCSARGLLDGGV